LKTTTPKKYFHPKQNARIKNVFGFARGWLTVCVTCVWAGVDSLWEQEKLEARKILENAAESHTSGARFVGRFWGMTYALLEEIFAKAR
jgi:hypothetical protein